MELYFLRHAKAVPRTGRAVQRDAERPLTPEGEAKTWLVAKGMQNLGLTFDQIWTSPLVRARRTAEIVAEALRLTSKLTLTVHLAPDGDPRRLMGDIKQAQRSLGRVLLVGHEPYLSELASTLVSGGPGMRLTLKKASLALLVTDALRYGRCASLEWLLVPRQLALLAKL
ncbi:MAG: phosphohistidine phosphatase SixA [Verrucomicrobia bacterium]|nr:phosphohistidine phosphatase SixA [Verrucomicrobiota bacterium]